MTDPSPLPESLPEGKVADFITNRFVRDTPEEYVRQNLEKALVRQYEYSREDCEPEFAIKVGSSRKRVDIAVFEAGTEHRQENMILLVETKKVGTSPGSGSEGVAQLQSYMAASVNATYGIWTNGDDRICFAKRQTSKGYLFEEVIDIPAFGQTELDAQRPKRSDLKAATGDNLMFAFRRCHNYIAANEGKQKPEAFWELLKVIFTKIEDERSSELSFYVTPSERSNATSASSAKARIQSLFEQKVVKKYPGIFTAMDTVIDLQPSVIAYVTSQLQGFSLLASPVDVKGIAYEEIVGANLRGDRGEFFTPRNACRAAVEMLDPRPDEVILDPACGTGGFLITAMNHALSLIGDEVRSNWFDPLSGSDEEREELFRARHEYLGSRVLGLDLNPGLVRAAKMNMVMNNDGAGGLFQANSLSSPHSWNPDVSARIAYGTIDAIVSNPPFGANIVIDDEEVLAQYDLAAIWDRNSDGAYAKRVNKHGVVQLQRSLPPEILFIERCVQLLREGGRLAIVLPNGILNNPGTEYVRTWLLRNTQVLAVVDMNRDLFQPRNDTQTSIVLMRKLNAQERLLAESDELDYEIFMAIAEKIGHDKRGNAIYRRTSEGHDELAVRYERAMEVDPVTGEDLPVEIEVFDRVIDDELPAVARSYRSWRESRL